MSKVPQTDKAARKAVWRSAFLAQERLQLVAYDISSDATRRQLVRFLKQQGYRLQRSVFGLPVRGTQQQRLLRELLAYYRVEEDRMLVTPLCANCTRRSRAIGEVVESFDDVDRWVV